MWTLLGVCSWSSKKYKKTLVFPDFDPFAWLCSIWFIDRGQKWRNWSGHILVLVEKLRFDSGIRAGRLYVQVISKVRRKNWVRPPPVASHLTASPDLNEEALLVKLQSKLRASCSQISFQAVHQAGQDRWQRTLPTGWKMGPMEAICDRQCPRWGVRAAWIAQARFTQWQVIDRWQGRNTGTGRRWRGQGTRCSLRIIPSRTHSSLHLTHWRLVEGFCPDPKQTKHN